MGCHAAARETPKGRCAGTVGPAAPSTPAAVRRGTPRRGAAACQAFGITDSVEDRYHQRQLGISGEEQAEREEAVMLVCPEMVIVPAGAFTMGSPPSELGCLDGEEQMRVTITQPFAVGKFAVTFDQWDACVADGGCNGYKPDDKGWGRGNRPVINVSWNDAKAFAGWLSRKTGRAYRLLSEAEHEYVTRAGMATVPCWRSERRLSKAFGPGRQLCGKPLGPFQRAWQCVGMDGRLFE
jgi:formylglycine-generating enzyme required for sulfatase activity